MENDKYLMKILTLLKSEGNKKCADCQDISNKMNIIKI